MDYLEKLGFDAKKASKQIMVLKSEAKNKLLKNRISKEIIKEEILNPMKEEHDKAIKCFIKRDVPHCLVDGGIAQVLGCFIGKIEELMEDK